MKHGIVKSGDRFRVLGSGALCLIGASKVVHSFIAGQKEDMPLFIRDLRLHVLSSGNGFELAVRKRLTVKKPAN